MKLNHQWRNETIELLMLSFSIHYWWYFVTDSQVKAGSLIVRVSALTKSSIIKFSSQLSMSAFHLKSHVLGRFGERKSSNDSVSSAGLHVLPNMH